MAAPRLSERMRKRLLALLGEDRPDPDRFMTRVRQLRQLDEVPACSEMVRLLANLTLPEPQAEKLLQGVLEHRAAVGKALGRDPGVHVAAADFLSNVEHLLTNPKIVEMSQFEQTQRSAVTDPLTGMFNRRYFRTAMRREVRRSRRYKLTFSLLMLDLDEFKHVNDEHGHVTGDLVLRRVGRLLRRTVREADVACRYGGEEFAVIFPETDRLGTYTVAERIRRRAQDVFDERPTGGRAIRMTVSGGIASFPEDGPDSAALVSRADETLYQAKRAGRNRIMLHPAERRRSVRYPARPSTRVGILSAQGGGPREALGINFSRLGALLETDVPYHAADPVRVVLGVGTDSPDEPPVVSAQVVRVEIGLAARERVRIGVAFEQPIAEELLMQNVRRSSVPRAISGGGS